MTPQKRAELFRNGEGDHEVRSGKHSLLLFVQPLLGFLVLAHGAVTIAAGLVDDMKLSAGLTLINGLTEISGTAVHDGLDDLLVVLRDVRIGLDILFAKVFEDPFEFAHGSEIFHQIVDPLIGILLPFLGEMEIDHGSHQLGMPQVALDGPDIDPGIQ